MKGDDDMGEKNEKPVLEVEVPSKDEVQAREMATAAALKGDTGTAKKHLAKASKLERMRLVAALIKAGDMDLAMEGLAEDEADHDMPVDEAPAADPAPVADAPCGDAPAEDAPAEDAPADEKSESDEAKDMAAAVTASLARGNVRRAKSTLAKLKTLENEIVAAVKVTKKKLKDSALAAEGQKEYVAVRKIRLLAELAVADAEGDEEGKKDALQDYSKMSEGEMDLSDTLDSDPSDEEADAAEMAAPVEPEGGKPEGDEAPASDDAAVEPAMDEEADAMHYEVLQSVEQIKAMKVDRNALSFTFWDHSENPYWVIQAAGAPVATVHLQDQDNASDIRAFFCSEENWPQAVATTTEKVGLYDTLKGIKARFYANEVEKSALAATLRSEAVASLQGDRTEKLANLRSDFTDALVVSAEALNKGLIASKPNALKAAFHKQLASLGIQNPSVIVEGCFAEGFHDFLEQIVADANEFLEMPKEAYEHTKKMIRSASNVAQAQAGQFEGTLAQRLAQNSLPVAPMADSSVTAQVYGRDSERDHRNAQRQRLGLSKKF